MKYRKRKEKMVENKNLGHEVSSSTNPIICIIYILYVLYIKRRLAMILGLNKRLTQYYFYFF